MVERFSPTLYELTAIGRPALPTGWLSVMRLSCNHTFKKHARLTPVATSSLQLVRNTELATAKLVHFKDLRGLQSGLSPYMHSPSPVEVVYNGDNRNGRLALRFEADDTLTADRVQVAAALETHTNAVLDTSRPYLFYASIGALATPWTVDGKTVADMLTSELKEIGSLIFDSPKIRSRIVHIPIRGE